jgi:hypothetical protein
MTTLWNEREEEKNNQHKQTTNKIKSDLLGSMAPDERGLSLQLSGDGRGSYFLLQVVGEIFCCLFILIFF